MNTGTLISTLNAKIDEIFNRLYEWFAMDSKLMHHVPDDEEWDIHQVLEHVSLVNHYLLKIITKGKKRALKKNDPALIEQNLSGYRLSDERLEEIGINDSFPWECPAHMIPTGDLSARETRERLRKQEQQCREVVESLSGGEGVLIKTTMSVNDLGKLDVYQYLYFLLLHAQRHLQQMEKIKSNFNK
jgi:hypothetical protein